MDNEKLAQFSDDSLNVSNNEPGGSNQEDASVISGERISRESEAKLMDSVIVNNEKVRYYYNKTLCLREPIGKVLDLLELLHGSTFAYLSQLPETGDYSIISTLFELIPTLSAMIDWDNMNHSCYWEDFCRETKQLQHILDKVNGAALKCADVATELLHQAQDLFPGAVESTLRHPLKIDRAISFRKESDYVQEHASGQSIQIKWEKPGDAIELMWHDADGGLLNVLLKETGTGFRLRFLRHIIYHARGLLEKAYLAFMKLNVALHLHIPMDKLMKCRDVHLKQLTQQEHACLAKAKREFDASLDLVWQLIARFKFQTFHLLQYSKTFKGMRKPSGFTPKTIPTFTLLKMSVDDSLLMRVMSSGIQAEANEESFDFTVFPDRTEDIVAKVEDLLTVDNSSYRELRVLLDIVRTIYLTERINFTEKEKASTCGEITMILAHRFQVRRSLKRALRVFEKHAAFYQMDQLKLVTLPASGKTPDFGAHDSVVSESETQIPANLDENEGVKVKRDGNNNEDPEEEKIWITLEGGVKITSDGPRGILLNGSGYSNDIKNFNDLNSDEKVILCVRAIRQLLVCVANEQCFAKICCAKISETKSLVKRLKIKDRQNVELQKQILEQHNHLRLMLHLTKTMRFLKY